jgi:C4-dicarboxylate-specific signal transduction histidine kinase
LRTQARGSDNNEQGSLAPLGIGIAMLSLATVLAVLASASLYLTERRLTTVAESTAISVLIDAKGNLSQSLSPFARRWLEQQPLRGLDQVELIEVSSIDQRTVRVRLCSSSKELFVNYIFSEIGRVCSEALARRGR